MRISTSYFSQAFLQSLLQQQTQLALTQNQISTGLQFSEASQNPSAATQSLTLEASVDQTAQYGTNSNLAQSRLSIEESTLGNITNLLQQVRNLAVQAANASQTPETRATIAAQVQQDLSSLLQLANTQDGSGQYIFAGTATGAAPFSQASGTFTYSGNQTQRQVQIGNNRLVADGDTGTRVFEQVRNGNGTFVVSTNPANAGTAIAAANSVTDPVAWAAGSPPYTLTFTAPGTYQITDSTAAVVQGGSYTDGQTLSFNGAQLTLSGTPATNDTFTIAKSANQNLFTTLQNLITTLTSINVTGGQAPVVNGINRAIEAIDQGTTQIANVRADVGSRLSAMSDQSFTNSNLTLQLKSTLSSLRDLDYASAVTTLNLQLVGLQAAQASFVKMQNLSLFNYIR